MDYPNMLRAAYSLSLELKDMAKIPEVAAIIAKVQKVLSLFWGRKRWPRRKLREVILQHTGKQFGLYRAKVTRFAGKFREMSRMLRVASCLRSVVVMEEYRAMKFTRRGTPCTTPEHLHQLRLLH